MKILKSQNQKDSISCFINTTVEEPQKCVLQIISKEKSKIVKGEGGEAPEPPNTHNNLQAPRNFLCASRYVSKLPR